MAFRVQPSLVEHDEFLCDDPQVVAYSLFDSREIGATHLVERRGVATDVLSHEVDLVAE